MDLEFNKNEDAMRQLIAKLNKKLDQIHLGGGKAKIEKHRAKGKLTARDRIEYLIDKDSRFFEIGDLVGDGMYEEYGGCPAGGRQDRGRHLRRARALGVAGRPACFDRRAAGGGQGRALPPLCLGR